MSQKFGLIIVGDEILSGKRADKHMSKVIELLGVRGLALAYAEYVGDDPERIVLTLERAFASGDVVFSTGAARVKLLVASVMRPMAAYLRGARPQRRPSRVPG